MRRPLQGCESDVKARLRRLRGFVALLGLASLSSCFTHLTCVTDKGDREIEPTKEPLSTPESVDGSQTGKEACAITVRDKAQCQDNVKSLVQRIPFKDFSKNAFEVTINRVQALALARAGDRVPLPEEQLRLMAASRMKKSKREAAFLGLVFGSAMLCLAFVCVWVI